MRAVILSALLWLPGLASAACTAPYTIDQVLSDLGTVESSLMGRDNAAAGAAATSIQQGLPCMNEVLPAQITGRVYRAIGSGLYAGGDMIGGFDWYMTALEVDPVFSYGTEDLPPDHPSRLAYEDAKRESQGDPVAVEGKQLDPAGVHYLDGRKISAPQARQGRPHLYQWEHGDVQSWVITSNDFPPQALGAAVAENTGKKKKDKNKGQVTTADGAIELGRERPPEKTPLIVGGLGIVAGAGALYMMSGQKLAEYNDATTLDEVETLKTSTNQLFLLSAGVLGVGVSTFSWGVILDGGTPIPTFGGRF
ncbi:MAG: hypothetical protein JXX28_07315 [Deltaproteobacteria bacterium]|nr:hypothetical protein [Deltaproteobacteria bacterium]